MLRQLVSRLSSLAIWLVTMAAASASVGCSNAATTTPQAPPYPEPAETREWTNSYAVVLDQYFLALYGSIDVSRVDLIVCNGTADSQADVRSFEESGATVALLLDTVGRLSDGDLRFGVAVALASGDVSNTQQRVELSATATFQQKAGGPRGLCLSSLRVEGLDVVLPGVDVSALNFGRP